MFNDGGLVVLGMLIYFVIGVMVGFLFACVGKKFREPNEKSEFVDSWIWGIPIWPATIIFIFYALIIRKKRGKENERYIRK